MHGGFMNRVFSFEEVGLLGENHLIRIDPSTA
jgi:hypothetical protein